MHLLLGATTTAAVLALAITRLRRRRREPIASSAWAAASLAVTLLSIAAGYVGGELLVYHGGMAVKAAGEGALAPPVAQPDLTPGSLEKAMEQIRPAWAAITATVAEAIVHEPTSERSATIRQNATRLNQLSQWLVHSGVHHAKGERGHFQEMAKALHESALEIERAATTQELGSAAAELGSASRACARCHQHERWSGGHGKH